MRSGFKLILLYIFILAISPANTWAQPPNKTRILFLFDASGSMISKLGEETRIDIAKRLLTKMVDSLRDKPNLEIALRVFGHTTHKDKKNCADTKLEVPFGKANHSVIQNKLKDLNPLGTTLIAYTLQEGAYDFPLDARCRNIIILITDGLEECGGDPCAVSEALQKKGVILKPFIIGVGLKVEFEKQFECVGRFFEANTKESFDNILQVILSQAMNSTTLQVNLLDENSNARETDVNMTFYDNHSGKLLENYIHTFNKAEVPDTIVLDPVNLYKITVHTLPPVHKDGVEIVAGRHTIVPIDAPQGSLKLRVDGSTNYKRLQCVVKKAGTHEVVNVQDFNTEEKYITGAYDIEILSTPKLFQKNVIVKQSSVNEVIIPQPGKLNLYARIGVMGAIYKLDNASMEWVINLNTNPGSQAIILQPGNYKLVFRANSDKRTEATRKIDFEIKSGQVKPLNAF